MKYLSKNCRFFIGNNIKYIHKEVIYINQKECEV